MNAITSIEALPHNVEIEQQIIGNVLVNNDLFHQIGFLNADHFYDPVHADIWKNLSGRIAKDHLASPVTLASDFENHDGLKELGGKGYLARMAGAAMSGFAIRDYAHDLVSLYARRMLLGRVGDVLDRVRIGLGADDAQSEIELFLHANDAISERPRSMSLLAAETKMLTEMNERMQTGKVGISTGLRNLDELVGGLHKGELTIAAGSTSMGKTAFGCWLAFAAARQNCLVGFASIEMGEVPLAMRFNAMESKIPYQAMRGNISEATFRAILEAAKAQESLPIHIYADHVRDMASILSETKRLQRMNPANEKFNGLGLLVIDYIQLVRGKGYNTLEVLSRVAIEAKQVAKSLNVPVVALAQVSRDLGKRENPIPFLSDLRGAGDLENAADNVIFCHRPEYYAERDLKNPNLSIDDRADLEAVLAETRGKMNLIVAKQRMGPIGDCWVNVDMGTNLFTDAGQAEFEL